MSEVISKDGLRARRAGYDIKLIRPGEDIHSAGVKTLSGHGGSVWSVCFSPDGTLLASGSYDGKVKVWGTLLASGIWRERDSIHHPTMPRQCVHTLPTSHTFTVLSSEPDARRVPSGEKQTERTLPLCPDSVLKPAEWISSPGRIGLISLPSTCAR
jgi:WD40 repeat protein